MSFEWHPFTELLSHIVDNRGKSCPAGEEGLPLIATNCINDGLHPSLDTDRFVSHETYGTWFRDHPLPGDILFVTKGSPGRTSWVPDPVDFCIAQDMVAVRANRKKVDAKYLFAALRSPAVQSQIGNMHVGTLVPHFKKGDFEKLKIPLPHRSRQETIGDMYFTLSERIALLSENGATLEAIAQAIFKSWFVDFDPVRAKQEGRVPEDMDRDTLALFPNGFWQSETGWLPKGWHWAAMDEISTVGIGRTPPRKESQWFSESGEGMPWASIKDMGNAGAFLLDTSESLTRAAVQKFNVRVVPENTVLLSFKLTIGRVSITGSPIVTNEAIAHFNIDGHSPLASEYIYLYLKQFNYKTLGSTSSIADAVNSKTVKGMRILVPDRRVLKAFQEPIRSIFQRIKLMEEQARTLSILRDTLLPRLVLGQLEFWQEGFHELLTGT